MFNTSCYSVTNYKLSWWDILLAMILWHLVSQVAILIILIIMPPPAPLPHSLKKKESDRINNDRFTMQDYQQVVGVLLHGIDHVGHHVQCGLARPAHASRDVYLWEPASVWPGLSSVLWSQWEEEEDNQKERSFSECTVLWVDVRAPSQATENW